MAPSRTRSNSGDGGSGSRTGKKRTPGSKRAARSRSKNGKHVARGSAAKTKSRARAPAPVLPAARKPVGKGRRSASGSPEKSISPADSRKTILFTCGNHMHWVDMQWLWGYDVLPASVRDMIDLCEQAGVKGNVNFDAIGYEKLAAENPAAMEMLQNAVLTRLVEPVGCSYGQPYALFHGGESNVRQFTFGVQTVQRLLNVRPRAFWEEEFYFYPQLPQVLAACGFTGANLFFQWTWHTPEIPSESAALINWQGIDGTLIPTLPRNDLNVHQWPEDVEPLLNSELLTSLDQPAIVQWIELLPSPDWMCRSELLVPVIKRLKSQKDFQIRAATMSELIRILQKKNQTQHPNKAAHHGHQTPPAVVRPYTLDDVWHGMTLPKNGYEHVIRSRQAEYSLLDAEVVASMAGLFGRPYPRWDVYPTWEIEEAWRELLSGQHHDNHESEGLCGSIGYASISKSQQLADDVYDRTCTMLAARAIRDDETYMVFNLCGFRRDITYLDERDHRRVVLRDVPPFGYRVVEREHAPHLDPSPDCQIDEVEDDNALVLHQGSFRVVVDRSTGNIRHIEHPLFPEGLLRQGSHHPSLIRRKDRGNRGYEVAAIEPFEAQEVRGITGTLSGPDGESIILAYHLIPTLGAIHIHCASEDFQQLLEPGFAGALRARLFPSFAARMSIITDSPYAVHQALPRGVFQRKYPMGDWMTSPQWLEEIEKPFTGLTFVDLVDGPPDTADRGLLIAHGGQQQFKLIDGGIELFITAEDPWDQGHSDANFEAGWWLVPHGPMTNADRQRLVAKLSMRVGISFRQPQFSIDDTGGGRGDDLASMFLPDAFGSLEVENAPNVLATAFHRQSMKSGENLPDWAGHRMFERSHGACDHPFVIRLAEFDGKPAQVVLKLPGQAACAAKTNLLGEVTRGKNDAAAIPPTAWLEVYANAEPPEWGQSITFSGAKLSWSELRFEMRPHEIATIMVDLVMGRKQWRDLDASRKVWAQVHRTGRTTSDDSSEQSGEKLSNGS